MAVEFGQGAVVIHTYPPGRAIGWRAARLPYLSPWWKPAYRAGPERGRYVLPLWIPAALGAIVAAWLRRRDGLYALGHCQKCGYDLTGNKSGVCPECGTKLKD
jgi:hypothetical protein